VNITIRRARPDEVSLLCELDVTIFSEEDAFDTPDLWNGLETFLILHEETVIGSIALKHDAIISEISSENDYIGCAGYLYIVSTGILPQWQGRGIGDVAKTWEINYAREQGFKRIVTNARVSNHRSINLNRKFGFKITKELPGWYGKEDAVVMELDLQGT